MVLGGLDKVSEKEIDFSPMEKRIGAIEDKQKSSCICLSLLLYFKF